MNDNIQDIYNNLDWIAERMDDLSERINDYIFFSGCDIHLTKASMKKLRAFNSECEELKARHDAEIRNLKKLLE